VWHPTAPLLQPAAVTDYTTGYLAAFGALMALERQRRYGGSYWVRVSLSRTGVWMRSLGMRDKPETQGFDASLDPASCLFQLFGGDALLSQQFLRIPFAELLTSFLAGEQTGGLGGPHQFLSLVLNLQKTTAADVTAPIAALNRLPNPPAAPVQDRRLCSPNSFGRLSFHLRINKSRKQVRRQIGLAKAASAAAQPH